MTTVHTPPYQFNAHDTHAWLFTRAWTCVKTSGMRFSLLYKGVNGR